MKYHVHAVHFEVLVNSNPYCFVPLPHWTTRAHPFSSWGPSCLKGVDFFAVTCQHEAESLLSLSSILLERRMKDVNKHEVHVFSSHLSVPLEVLLISRT